MNSIITYVRKLILNKLEKPSSYYEQRIYNNINNLYSVIQPGDVVLVEGRSEMSRLIKLFSSSHWSHAAIYVGNALLTADKKRGHTYLEKYGKDANYMIIEAFSGEGVIAAPLRKYEDYNIRLCRPYGILKSDLGFVIEQAINSMGMQYDDQNIFDIALMSLQTIFQTKSSYTLRACLGNCNNFQIICSGMIAQAFQKVGYPIVPTIIPLSREDLSNKNNPYGGGLIMRHFTQITPKDFDLSPNFEIIKFNLIGTKQFDYKSLWIDRI